MACNFSIEFPQSPHRVVEMAQKAIKGAGGQFSGDNIGGEFSLSTGIGHVKGEYTILNQTLSVIIHTKPAFITCNQVEKQIRKYVIQEPA